MENINQDSNCSFILLPASMRIVISAPRHTFKELDLCTMGNQAKNMQNPNTKEKFKNKRINIPVAQINPQTNQIIKVYESACVAAKDPGITAKNSTVILRACRMEKATSCGHMWKFVPSMKMLIYKKIVTNIVQHTVRGVHTDVIQS